MPILLSLLLLSIVGGYAISPLSRGERPGTVVSRSTFLHDAIDDVVLVGSRFNSFWWRSASFAVYPESDRVMYEAFLASNPRPVDLITPPGWVIRKVEGGVLRCTRGSIGPLVGVWSWQWQTREPQSGNLEYPQSGVTRVFGVPFAYKPVFPGILLAWVVGYGLLRGLLAAATWCWRAITRCIARHRPQPGHCQNCSYDLTGIDSSVCPECGGEQAEGDRA
ncbi:MAG: hypothetical protein LAT64_06345 [Phycisphaerales bacterium]|nr:hypothetical protein [Planctomycetota bacterium]MCH8508375.1 hypothetical protein [Phycisphaerales bacterium]